MNELEDMLKAVFDGTDVRVFAIDEEGTREITSPQPPTVVPDLVKRFPKWRLVDTNSMQLVPLGETLRDSDGGEWLLTGGAPPHKPESTGRVYVEDVEYDGDGLRDREFFPSVFDLKWYHISEVTDHES